MAPQRFSSVDAVIDRLADVSRTIRLRTHLKPVEEKRVESAFTLVSSTLHPTASSGAKKQVYQDLLRSVQTVVGPYGVVVCAAALGISAVAGMKDRLRVEIPTKMKEREKDLLHDTLQSIANSYSVKCELYS
jgi:type IV secretory pathway VirB2 component (pilin)